MWGGFGETVEKLAAVCKMDLILNTKFFKVF